MKKAKTPQSEQALRNEEPAVYTVAPEGADDGAASEQAILDAAEAILRKRFQRSGMIDGPESAGPWLRMKLAPLDHEAFGVLMMDTRHAIIGLDILFHGSVDICSVIPREIVRAVIKRNAAAVILVHNHPSGSTEPSEADRRITQDIKKALSLIECRVLDHLIVGENITSFAKRNMM